MDIGDYNRQVRIVALAEGEDAYGQPVDDWSLPVCAPWANIRHLSGIETLRGNAPVSIVRASIRINQYRPDVRANMRVIDDADVYDIKAVLLDKVDREFTDLSCELLPA